MVFIFEFYLVVIVIVIIDINFYKQILYTKNIVKN
ncbi:hypothetical protein DOY81_008495, partial [Sarcophaga bullata]